MTNMSSFNWRQRQIALRISRHKDVETSERKQAFDKLRDAMIELPIPKGWHRAIHNVSVTFSSPNRKTIVKAQTDLTLCYDRKQSAGMWKSHTLNFTSLDALVRHLRDHFNSRTSNGESKAVVPDEHAGNNP